MPSRVMVKASSMQFTPSQSARSAAIGATVSRPCPYAFAFTTTIKDVPAAMLVRNASMLFRSRCASISTQDNIDAFRTSIAAGTSLMVVVKANAYGHGLETVAPIAAERADWLG